MADPSVVRRNESFLQKWFGPNHGTHWNIAGAVAVIILGGYLIYSMRDSDNPIMSPSATVQTPAPIAPAPPASKK